MRNLVFLLASSLLATGCGGEAKSSSTKTIGQVPPSDEASEQSERERPSAEVIRFRRKERLPPVADPRTRKDGDDWPSFLGPTGDSKSREKGIFTDWTNGLRIRWHAKLGQSYGMPAISRGRLFQFDGVRETARLVCMESETGKELWHFDYTSEYDDLLNYENGPRAAPVVDDDRVYVVGAEGMLHCLDVRDGSVIWKLDTVEKFNIVQNFFGVGSTPVIEGDLLIMQIGGSPPPRRPPTMRLDLVKGNGTGIVAFDKRTGDVKYHITDELASYATPKLATINGRRWCFVFARGGLVGFDPTTGKVDFHYPWRAKVLESVNASTPVVFADRVFISETYGPGSSLLRVKPGGYDVLWSDSASRREKAMQTHWNTPVYHDGFLYGSSGRHTENAELRCIEFDTGKVRWSQPGLTRSSLLYADGYLICLTEYGDLILLRTNPEKYDEVARTKIEDPQSGRDLLHYPCWAAPIISHGLLYVRGKDRLVCLEFTK
jgi:outer membrane protein assembly factor BamB